MTSKLIEINVMNDDNSNNDVDDDYDNDVNSKDAYELLCICVYV